MTPQQALAIANMTKLARREAKRQLAAGQASLAEVIDTGCCDTMSVQDLLGVLPWWGPVRVRRLLKPLGLDADAKVGALSDAERKLLVAAYRREMAHLSEGRRKRRAS